MKKKKIKFGIGTAQLIDKYGILKKKTKKTEFQKIFKNFNKKIDIIDTAPSYSNSEEIIGQFSSVKYKISTKLDKIKSKKINNIISEIDKKIKTSLSKLNRTYVDYLLIHNEKDIKFFKEKKTILYFKNQIKKKKIIKVGISVYNMDKIDEYLKIYKFDVIQIPLHLFNISNKNIKNLKILKKKYNFEIHARSIFFQGTIFEKIYNLPNKLQPLKKKIKELNVLVKKYKTTKKNFAISCVDNTEIIDYIIVGISNFKEFKDLLDYRKINIKNKDLKTLALPEEFCDLRNIKNFN